MKQLIYAAMMLAVCALGGACNGGSCPAAKETDNSDSLPERMLSVAVLDSARGTVDDCIDSAVKHGNAYDLAIAFNYYYHLSARDTAMRRRALEVYDRFKAENADDYGAVLYNLSKEIEQHNYARMVDRQVEYLRYSASASDSK